MGGLLWFTMSEEASLLVSAETYEENAVNIGTQQKSADMSRFIDRVREDGLYLLDINITDARIRSIAALLNTYDAPSIMVVSARQYGQRPARMFAEAVGAHSAVGRFIPGSLTNPALRSYIEPDILFVTDPANDQQALREAVATGLPIVGIVDANNHLRNVDIALSVLQRLLRRPLEMLSADPRSQELVAPLLQMIDFTEKETVGAVLGGDDAVPISVNELGASDLAPDFQSWDLPMLFRLPFRLQLPSTSVGEIMVEALSVQAGPISIRISGLQFSSTPIVLIAEELDTAETVRETLQS